MTAPDLEALPFQDPLDRVIATPASRGLRLWPVLAAAFLSSLVLAAALLPIDIVVTAPGRLAAAAPPIQLKPYTAATLREVLVEPGDVVVAGQVLARLDATFPAANRAILAADLAMAEAVVARIEAELAGTELAVGTAEAALQSQVREERAALVTAQRAALAAEVAERRAEAASEADTGESLAARLAIAREVHAMRATLARAEVGSRLAAMEAEVLVLSAAADLRRHEARTEALAQAILAAEARARAFDLELRRELLDELARAGLHLVRLREEMTKADALSAGTELTAPRPGVVLTVASASAGSLVGAGEAVLVLVPADVPLIAEINLLSADIGRLVPGDAVTVKVDAFPWRQHGALQGRLEDVSSASITPPGGGPSYHMARVSLDPAGLRLEAMPEGAVLLPGMTLGAEVRTGTRSILDYFIDPLLRGFNESLREP